MPPEDLTTIIPEPPAPGDEPSREVYQSAVEMLESGDTAVMVVDSHATIRYLSPTAERWLHHEAGRVEHQYKVGILMESDEATRHIETFIPRVVTGQVPSRLMAGGRFVPAITRLGTRLMLRIGYQNTIIAGHPYAVVIMCRKNLKEQVITSWQKSRAVAGRVLMIGSAVIGTLITLVNFITPHLETTTTEVEADKVIINKD
jgi:nitrogen-specific signal transduction histidine kinase